MELCKRMMKAINKELGTEAISIEAIDDHYAIFVKYEDKIDYAVSCDDEDIVFNELSALLNGIELAKAVFNKED